MSDTTSRRAMLLGAVGIVAASSAMAQTHDHSQHQHGAAAGKKATGKTPLPKLGVVPEKFRPVVAAAKLCEQRGQVCRAHCLRVRRTGDTSLEECRKLVEATLAVCAATAKLAMQDAKRFKDMAKVCLDVCVDCEAECKKHAGHHAECKGCMEACQAMISALKPVLAG